MRIDSKITNKVNESVAECRKCLTDATIALLKTLGAESGQDVLFGKMLILHHFKGGNSETMLADRIAYMEGAYIITTLAGNHPASSYFISIDNLQTIYNEVRNIVRKH